MIIVVIFLTLDIFLLLSYDHDFRCTIEILFRHCLIIIYIINQSFISDNSPYGDKKKYKTQVKNNKNKWQSIKHVTNNKYTQSHMHYTGLFDIENAIPPFSDR